MKRQWNNSFKISEEKSKLLQNSVAKISFKKTKAKIKMFVDIYNLEEFITSQFALYDMLKEVLPVK